MSRPRVHLPMRDGVSPSTLALPAGRWPSISHFFAQRFPTVTHEDWVARMHRGDVVDAQGRPIAPDAPYRPHTRLHYYRSLPPERPIPFAETIVYQDERILVADKPHYLPVTPKGRYLQETLLVRLKRRLGIDTLVPAHRIDRETAGLVLFTIAPTVRDAYQSLFRDRAVTKHYEAIAPWRADLPLPLHHRCRIAPGANFMQMRVASEAEGPSNAETHIDLLEKRGEHARYRLSPITGQKHQLRVQMAALGIPILHDQIYPHHQPETPLDEEPDYSRPLQLLAKALAFVDPVSGEVKRFESGLRLSNLKDGLRPLTGTRRGDGQPVAGREPLSAAVSPAYPGCFSAPSGPPGPAPGRPRGGQTPP